MKGPKDRARQDSTAAPSRGVAAGKVSLAHKRYGSVQRKAASQGAAPKGSTADASAQETASEAVGGPGQSLPHLDAIFGGYGVGAVRAPVGSASAHASEPIGDGGAKPVQLAKGETAVAPATPSGPEMQQRMKSSAGTSLDAGTAAAMGTHFKTDFANVRVHTDSPAADLCSDSGAKALTSGSNIFFGSGQYDPGSDKGRELIGHELTHVVQQSEGRASGLAAKEENDTGGSRGALEKEADTEGARAAAKTKDAAAGGGGPVNWSEVDKAKLTAHLDKLSEAGHEVPVASEPTGVEKHPLMAEMARQFVKTAPATAPGGDAPAQADKESNWWIGGTYNMVEVTGIPAKFVEHGKTSDAKAYNFYEHGHLDWKTKGANSRRDGNFGIEIKGSGKPKKYNYDAKTQPEWSRAVQMVVGGASDRKTVSMHNWAFSNIEASDWFDVVPGALKVKPGAEFVVHGVEEKMPFALPANTSLTVGYSQILSTTAGITTDQSLGHSTTRTRSITAGLKAGLEKKDVYKVGASAGLSSTNVSTVWDKVSSSVARANSTSVKATDTVAIKTGDKPEHHFVYPVWSVLPIKVQAYPHDGYGKVPAGGAPVWFTIHHMQVLHLKDMPASEVGEMKPLDPSDPALAADKERVKALGGGTAINVGGHRVTIAMDRERSMVKDWDNQKEPLRIYNTAGYNKKVEFNESASSSFVQADASGQDVSSTGGWDLGVSGEYLGLGGSFGYSESKTTAASYGDSVAKSGGKTRGKGLEVNVSVPGPADPKKEWVQLSLVPMYTERVYRFAIYDSTTSTWGPWLKNRAKSKEYAPMPAMIRTVKPAGVDATPVGPEKLDPSAAQKKSAKSVKELKSLRDAESDPAKKKEYADQIEAVLEGVRKEHEVMVRKVHSTLEAVDRDNNLYKITVDGRVYHGTLEVLADFTPPSKATLSAGDRLYSKDSTETDGTKVEVAGGLGGTGAQGRINPFPGDIDLSEQIKVTASSPDAAAQALARMIQSTVRDATKPTDDGRPPMQFLKMTCGALPPDSKNPGGVISWLHSQVMAGSRSYKKADGSTGTITLAEAFATPNAKRACNTFWRGPIDSKGSIGEITKVMAYEAIDKDTGKSMFATKKIGQAYQEVSLEKPVSHDTNRMGLMDALSPQIADYAKDGDWVKALKRALTVARMSGDFEAVNDFSPLLGLGAAELKTVTEHTDLFNREVVNNRRVDDQREAHPKMTDVVTAEAALDQANQLSSRIARLDIAIGGKMDAAIRAAGDDIRRNRTAYRTIERNVVKPLKIKLGRDKAYEASAKSALIHHGYLKSGDLK